MSETLVIPGGTTSQELFDLNTLYNGDLAAMEAAFNTGTPPSGYDLVDLMNAIIYFGGGLPEAIIAPEATFEDIGDLSEEEAGDLGYALQYWMDRTPGMEAVGNDFFTWLADTFTIDVNSPEFKAQKFIEDQRRNPALPDNGGGRPGDDHGETVYSLFNADDVESLLDYVLKAYNSPSAVLSILIMAFQTNMQDITEEVANQATGIMDEVEKLKERMYDLDPESTPNYQAESFDINNSLGNLNNSFQMITEIIKKIQDMMNNLIQTQAATNEAENSTQERLIGYIAQ